MAQYGQDYVKTPIGICKFLEIIFCIVVIALCGRTYSDDLLNSLFAGGIVGLILAFLILVLSVVCGDKCDGILKFQWLTHFLCAVLLLVTGIMSCVDYSDHDKILCAGIFAILAGVVFLVDCVLCFKDSR
ncbi:unnamed protein product [Callosobruchus maculatus]|uniref:MARVEL domain-containing protein n=1 Tax=Callosobruchus maculatus TaxID=64391 RepID=A0A653C1G0_CALMS|nr:unnamed protein product [Callosobruchus maculatus]